MYIFSFVFSPLGNSFEFDALSCRRSASAMQPCLMTVQRICTSISLFIATHFGAAVERFGFYKKQKRGSPLMRGFLLAKHTDNFFPTRCSVFNTIRCSPSCSIPYGNYHVRMVNHVLVSHLHETWCIWRISDKH